MKALNIVNKDGLCVGYIILACSIIVCSGFAFWLYRDTDMEKHIKYLDDYRRLQLYERYENVSNLRSETLAELVDDELNQIWLPLIQKEPDGYWKLKLYARLLAGNPDREESYKEIAAIINSVPEVFHSNMRTRYLNALKEITGVHDELLERHGLLTIDNS